MTPDFNAIKTAACDYQKDMVAFLRKMISYPSESCEEGAVAECIRAEMEKLGFQDVGFDGLGNVIGWMGEGEKIIAIDSHIDTVGIGNIENWTHDPYEGYEDDEVIYGRGGSDQEGGMAAAVYGTRIMADLGLIPEGYKIMVVGSVMKTVMDFAGSTLSTRTEFARNSSFPQSRLTEESTEDTAAVWKSASTSRVFPATVRHRNAVTTPFSRWRILSRMCARSTTTDAETAP